jgi:phosphopantothenoylcysteine decarboxylase/phosphopantothenate--cysteine ligase
MANLKGKRVVLGVTGGIAAYKAVELLRLLVKAGADVRVVMTPAAMQFVQPLTFRELSYHPVVSDMFAEPKQWLMQHLSLAEGCDVMVIAPATVNTIAKIAHGIADNLLCTTVLATTVPVVLAPAADTHMWSNPITQHNVAKLRQLGYHFVGPGTGQLARNVVGEGRMAEPAQILDKVTDVLGASKTNSSLADLRILITAGPTQEPIDPVRFLSNRSSGKMGYALAEAACQRGANVTLVSGPVALPAPDGVELVAVETVAQMHQAVCDRFAQTDICIGAAAPADYRVAAPAKQKIKRQPGEELQLQLTPTEDILAQVGAVKNQQVIVAFAAETKDLLVNSRAKLVSKNADMLVANDVTAPGSGFNVDTNQVTLLFADGHEEELPLMPKRKLADIILDRACELYRQR